MKLTVRAVQVAFVAFVCPIAASADPITLVISARSVSSRAVLGLNDGSSADQQVDSNALNSTSTITGASGSATSMVGLESIVSASTGVFAGGGFARVSQTATAEGSGASGSTNYLATFDVTEPQQFTFTGSFTSSGHQDHTLGDWRGFLFEAPDNVEGGGASVFDFSGFDTRNVSATGLLPVGRWGFEVQTIAQTFAADASTADIAHTFSLAFSDPGTSQTPEPASLLLLGGGLVAAFRRSREKRPMPR